MVKLICSCVGYVRVAQCHVIIYIHVTRNLLPKNRGPIFVMGGPIFLQRLMCDRAATVTDETVLAAGEVGREEEGIARHREDALEVNQLVSLPTNTYRVLAPMHLPMVGGASHVQVVR
jgi:hypothetical protein